MYVDGHITSDWVTALPALRNHPDVYLADTTSIQVWHDYEPAYGDTIVGAHAANAGQMMTGLP
jgi:hypothetical protein